MNTTLRGGIDTYRALVTAAGLTIVLGLAACGGGGEDGNGPGSKTLDLVIGNSLPLSGSSRSLGESGRKASELAVDQIEHATDSAGADHRVRIANEDQGSGTDAAVESAKKLVSTGRASCLTGPWSSEAVAQTAQDIAMPAKVLEISPVATGDDVAELSDHDLIDSTALPVSAEGDALAKAIERSLGGVAGHRVNVAASTDPIADTISQDFIQTWQDGDGTVGGQIVLAPPPLSSQASQITGNPPDAILLVDDPTGFAQLAPALESSSGWNPAIAWGSDQLVSPGLPEEVGPGTVEGMRALAPGSPREAEAPSAFVENFKSASPRKVTPAPFAAQEFDATILCYLAAV